MRRGSSDVSSALLIVFMLALFAGLLALKWFSAIQESRTYNRLTGAETTTWDALWVELRVQDEPQRGAK